MFRYNQTQKQVEVDGLLPNAKCQFIDTINIAHDLAYDFDIVINHTLETTDVERTKETYFLIINDNQPWRLYYKKDRDSELESIPYQESDSLQSFREACLPLNNKKEPTDFSPDNIEALKSSLIDYRLLEQLPKTKSHVNMGTHVTTASANAGLFLFSKNFNPCQAAVAKLHDGRFVLYHAFTAEDNSDGFKKFVELTKNNADYIYVFQKQKNASNIQKAPYLALNLSKQLQIDVKRINVDNYQAIVVDANSDNIILCMSVNFVHPKAVGALDTTLTTASKIDTTQAIPVSVSVNEIITNAQHNVLFKKNEIAVGSTTIPIAMVSQPTIQQCKKMLSTDLYKAAKKEKIKKAKKLIANGAEIELAIQFAANDNEKNALTVLKNIAQENSAGKASISDNPNTHFTQKAADNNPEKTQTDSNNIEHKNKNS